MVLPGGNNVFQLHISVCLYVYRAGECGSLPHTGCSYRNSGASSGRLWKTRVSPWPAFLILIYPAIIEAGFNVEKLNMGLPKALLNIIRNVMFPGWPIFILFLSLWLSRKPSEVKFLFKDLGSLKNWSKWHSCACVNVLMCVCLCIWPCPDCSPGAPRLQRCLAPCTSSWSYSIPRRVSYVRSIRGSMQPVDTLVNFFTRPASQSFLLPICFHALTYKRG